MLCEYGCNQESKYITSNGKNACSTHASGCPAIKDKNSKGLKNAYAVGIKKPMAIVYSELPIDTKDKMAWSRGKAVTANADIFKLNSTWSNMAVRNRIKQDSLIDYKCQMCNICKWNNMPITFELDHVNGNNRDNRLENLRFLCPNCHSQTDTYKGKNINTGKIKVSDDELLTAYKKCGNIHKALIEVGLAAKGGNYSRLKKLIAGVV